MTTTVEDLVNQLIGGDCTADVHLKFPANAIVYAYEGESSGIGIIDPDTHEQIGWIEAKYPRK